MEEVPSSPTTLVVSSPRRTLSLLRERRSSASSSDVAFSFNQDRLRRAAGNRSAADFAGEHGPKPSDLYGFVGSITTVIATVIYLVWAYTPEPWLHSLGITYYPSKFHLNRYLECLRSVFRGADDCRAPRNASFAFSTT